MKKRIFVLMLAISFVLMQGVVFAANAGHGGKDMHKMSTKEKFFRKVKMIYMHQDELAISDKQLDKIKKLKIDLKKELIRKDADIELIRIDIEALMYEDKMDLGAINKLIDQKYEVKKAKAKKTIASYAKLKEILSEQQMKDLKKLCKEKHRDQSGK